MGYATRAEYTIRLLREPEAHDHISRRFVATAFILASSMDESALEFLLQKWREIDAVTSNRIRFLFFVDNETTLTGYPQRPYFTESGYKRHHARMLRIAREHGFDLSVQAGAQVAVDFARADRPDWNPEEKVRRLAQQLGLTGVLPCIVWCLDCDPNTIYVKSLKDCNSNEIHGLLRTGCDAFYDDNAAALSRIDEIEEAIERVCGETDLTVAELRRSEQLLATHKVLSDVLWQARSRQSDVYDPACAAESLTAFAVSLRSVADFVQLQDVGRVVRHSAKIERLVTFVLANVEHASTAQIPHVVNAYRRAIDVSDILPGNALCLSAASAISVDPELADVLGMAFCHDSTTWVKGRAEDALVTRMQRFVGHLRTLITAADSPPVSRGEQVTEEDSIVDAEEAALVTLLNGLRLASEVAEAVPDEGGVFEKTRSILAERLKDNFMRRTHAVVVSLYFWLHQKAAFFATELAERVHRSYGLVGDRQHDVAKQLEEIAKLSEEVNSISRQLKWPHLAEFAPRKCEYLYRNLDLDRSDELNGRHQYKTLADSLDEYLVPIAEAMTKIAAVDPMDREEFQAAARSLSAKVIVNGTGDVFLGDRTEIYADQSVVNYKSRLDNVRALLGAPVSDSGMDMGNEVRQALQEFSRKLEEAHEEHIDEVELLSERLEELSNQIAKPAGQRKRTLLELSAKGLMEAAKAVGDIVPGLIKTAEIVMEKVL